MSLKFENDRFELTLEAFYIDENLISTCVGELCVCRRIITYVMIDPASCKTFRENSPI